MLFTLEPLMTDGVSPLFITMLDAIVLYLRNYTLKYSELSARILVK